MNTITIMLARTARRERMDVDHGERWAEYRLVRTAWDGYAVEHRYIRTEGDTITEGEWEPWQIGRTRKAAVYEGIGDTAYMEAESLHRLHATAVARCRTIRAAHDRVYRAEKALAAAQQAADEYKYTCNRDFSKRIAGKTDAQAEAIRKRMLVRRGRLMASLSGAVDAAEAELTAAKAALPKGA